MRTFIAVCCLLCTLVATVPASWGLAAQYRVVALEALAVLRIDRDTDEVLVIRLVNGQVHGFVGTPHGPPLIDLGLLPDGTFLYPFGGRGGRIVGMGSTGPYGLYTHAFNRQPATGLVDVGTAGGADLVSVATDANASEIVGYGTTPTSADLLPFRWAGGTILTVLPTLGGTTGWLNAVNDVGTAIGVAAIPDGTLHAALWPPSGGVVDLHTLASGSSVALDLNVSGQVVGEVQTPDGPRGFVTTGAPPGMVLLQPLAGDSQSSAHAVNDAGDSVGRSARPGPVADQGHETAVAWDATGTPVELATRVVNGAEWELRSARGINTAGLIAGVGTLQGAPTGFVLIPLDTAQAPTPAPPRNLRPRR